MGSYRVRGNDMSLAVVHEQYQWGNQYYSPWTDAVKSRFTELWARPLTLEQISDALFAEFNHRWSTQSLTWKSARLNLPARHQQTIWSKEATVMLRALWREGEGTRRIADSIRQATGIEFTKSAIIGKAHRLGLERHKNANRVFASEIERAIHRKNRRATWDSNNRHRPNRYRQRIAQRETAPSIADFSIPEAQRKTVFELGQHDCRWPVGDPQSDLFFFCGAVVESDRPYCSSHCRRAYVEIRPR